jgi:hypothetical protein
MAPPDDPVTDIRTWPAFGDRIAQRVAALDTMDRKKYGIPDVDFICGGFSCGVKIHSSAGGAPQSRDSSKAFRPGKSNEVPEINSRLNKFPHLPETPTHFFCVLLLSFLFFLLASFAFGKRGSDERLIDLAFDSFKRHC